MLRNGTDDPRADRPHVVIVGAGFGGLRAARQLARAPVRVTLIDRRNYHLFQPLLYQVATSMLNPGDIAHPVRAILRGQQNLSFRLAEVEGIDFETRRVDTTTGALHYDSLILAVGGQTNFFGVDSVQEHAWGLKDLDDARSIRNQILRSFELAVQEEQPERRRAHLTFVVVGGGPTGVESAGALSELIRLVLARDFRGLEIKDVRVILLEASHQLLAAMPEKLREATAEELWRKHVEVRFGAQVTDYDGARVVLKSGEIIPAGTLIWAAGVRAAELTDHLGVERDRLGRIKVDDSLCVATLDDVYAIGDAALLENQEEPLPMLAPVAIKHGALAARNILHRLAGEPLETFSYRDTSAAATIGRKFAVARLGRLQFKGFFAWIVWLVAHLVFLVGFRNRVGVMLAWAWEWFTYERAFRLIDSRSVAQPAHAKRRRDQDRNAG